MSALFRVGLKESVTAMKQPSAKAFLPFAIFQREEGISLAEFALILPIFLLILLGMVDMGQGFNTYIGMLNATREGVIWLANNPDDLTGMNTRISTELGRVGLTSAAMTITCTPSKSTYEEGDFVTLIIEYPYQVMFGAITGIPTLTLHTEHTMRVGVQ
jgi:Flp pilus assembly protein TadG